MGATKNMFMGIVHAAIALTTFVILPWTGLNVVKTLDLGAIGAINYARFNIDDILFYMQSLGIIQVGLAFAKGSSPKYSKRKAIFGLCYVLGGGAYTYIIRYSGLSSVPIILTGIGEVTVNFDMLMMMIFGIVILNAGLFMFDLIVAIHEQRKKIVYSLDKEYKDLQVRGDAP